MDTYLPKHSYDNFQKSNSNTGAKIRSIVLIPGICFFCIRYGLLKEAFKLELKYCHGKKEIKIDAQ